jgi:putative membrane protein
MKFKLGTALLFFCGLMLAVVLIAKHGFAATSQSVLSLGWGLVVLAIFHLLPMAFSGIAWGQLLHGVHRLSPWTAIYARLVRESADNLLPLFVVGGQVIGARILALFGVPASLAGASVVVDLTMEALSQCIFTLLGLVLLFSMGRQGSLVYWMALGLIIVTPGLIGLALLQKQGIFARFEAWLEHLAHKLGWQWLGGVSGLDEAIQKLYSDHRNLALSFIYHLLGWVVGVGEIWLILWMMGMPLGVAECFVIESLGQAVRSVGFAIPGALGVQEGGYMLLGAVFGLSHETGLTISLVKRVREIIKGTPALLAWQWIEGRRLWSALSTPRADVE